MTQVNNADKGPKAGVKVDETFRDIDVSQKATESGQIITVGPNTTGKSPNPNMEANRVLIDVFNEDGSLGGNSPSINLYEAKNFGKDQYEPVTPGDVANYIANVLRDQFEVGDPRLMPDGSYEIEVDAPIGEPAPPENLYHPLQQRLQFPQTQGPGSELVPAPEATPGAPKGHDLAAFKPGQG
jgi:hypothetical protein